MATSKKAKQKPEEIVPAKHGTFGPESGPYGETVIDPEASPLTQPEAAAVDPKEAKAQERRQAKAENTKAARKVKVVARQRAYVGNRIIEPGTVVTLDLEAGQEFPRWAEAVDEGAATTPLNHSSEAKAEKIED